LIYSVRVEFGNIEGYHDLKDIVTCALDAEDNYNLLFIGPPASAKTLFLLGILDSTKGLYLMVPTPQTGYWMSWKKKDRRLFV
jgi:hypothetical protein